MYKRNGSGYRPWRRGNELSRGQSDVGTFFVGVPILLLKRTMRRRMDASNVVFHWEFIWETYIKEGEKTK